MSVEVIAISAFIVAVIGALATCIQKIGLKKCHACCIDSDCIDNENKFEKQLGKLEEKIEKNKGKINKMKEKRCNSEPITPVSISEEIIETYL